MLNERISKFCDIGNKEGLYFIYRSLLDGFSSLSSLKQFILHYSGHIEVEVEAVVLLFHELKIVKYSVENDFIDVENRSILDRDDFFTYFSEAIVNLAIYEDIISLDSITYDAHLDRFWIAKKCIKLKYAFLRNLFITLNLFEKRTSSTYFISSNLVQRFEPLIHQKRKVSQKELIAQLEQNALQGEAGEIFVLAYEKNRLKRRDDLDLIKQVSIYDVRAGYDIISFDNDTSEHLDRLIEVKTYVGKPHFHWSSNELNIAKLKGNQYYLYLVSYNDITTNGYEPLIIKNPAKYFEDNSNWHFSVEGYLVNMI